MHIYGREKIKRVSLVASVILSKGAGQDSGQIFALDILLIVLRSISFP